MADFRRYTDVLADDQRPDAVFSLVWISTTLLYLALMGLVIWLGPHCSKDGWYLLDRCVPYTMPPS